MQRSCTNVNRNSPILSTLQKGKSQNAALFESSLAVVAPAFTITHIWHLSLRKAIWATGQGTGMSHKVEERYGY